MKKAIALFLALMLALSLCPVLAEEATEVPGTLDMPYAGLRYVPPESFRNLKGLVLTDGAIKFDEDIWYAYWAYLAMTEEEYQAARNDPNTQLGDRVIIFFHVFSIGNGMNFQDFNSMIGNSISEQNVREIGKVGDTTFYLCMEEPNQDYIAAVAPEYAEEYKALTGAADEIASAFTFSEPVAEPDPYAGLTGAEFRFTTTDLDGKTVSSEDLFSANEITMVNIWATWCGPCIGELAELQQIHTRMQGKNCGIVGMLTDENLEEAHRLVADNGVAYPVVLAPAELYDLLTVEYIPTTIFVDRNGKVLSSPPIVGAQVDAYEPALDSLLQQ